MYLLVNRKVLAILSAPAHRSNSKEGNFSALVTSGSCDCIFITLALPLPDVPEFSLESAF